MSGVAIPPSVQTDKTLSYLKVKELMADDIVIDGTIDCVSLDASTFVRAGTTVTAGTGVIATTGGVTATAGNIVATAGNIAATAGSVSAGTTVTAGTGITSTTGNVTATAGSVVAGAGITSVTGCTLGSGASSTCNIGSGTGALIGFYAKAAVVQPTTAITAAAFVANTSGIADDTATFGGYTIGKVVASLKAVGLLA